jgi:uncharacterized protein (DUF2147 family)
MKSILSALCLASAVLAFSPHLARSEPLVGAWRTVDASSHVRFEPCGTRTCGRIFWLREPIDSETGQQWRDKLNPDDTLRRRSLLGLVIVSGLRETVAGQWQGELYNPLDGRTYGGHFRVLDADRLELKGCALAGLICQSEIWVRIGP